MAGCGEKLGRQLPRQVGPGQGHGGEDPAGPQGAGQAPQRVIKGQVMQRGDRHDRIVGFRRERIAHDVTEDAGDIGRRDLPGRLDHHR